MSQKKIVNEREEECSSQENAKKRKKLLRRTDDEVLELLKSWRDKDSDDKCEDSSIDRNNDNKESTEPLNQIGIGDIDLKARVYAVIYGKNKPYKKHKTFEFDGTLIVSGVSATLKDCDGLIVTRCSEYKNNELEQLKDGSHLIVGDQLCEICNIEN